MHLVKLTNPEIERLSCLIEECGEVIQVVGKIQRHGFEHRHIKYGNRPNRENLTAEIADLLIAIERMVDNEDIFEEVISYFKTVKLSKIDKSLRYNKTKKKNPI